MKLQGQIVLITGASSGIGAAAAAKMAREGAHVLLLARRAERLQRLAGEIQEAGGEVHTYPVDLADIEQTIATTRRIQGEVGTPDVIVNNAGAGRYLSLEETSSAEAVEMMQVPYMAAFTVTRAFLPGMLARGSGQIINITSPAGYVAFPGAVAYSVGRWAMRGFAEALWADLHGTRIQATLLVAGLVSSEYFISNPDSAERLPGISVLFPTLTPEQVASALVWATARRPKVIVIPFMLRLAFIGQRFFPGLFRTLVYRSGYRRHSS